MQVGERLGRLGEVGEHARRRESRPPALAEQRREVGALDPVHRDDVARRRRRSPRARAAAPVRAARASRIRASPSSSSRAASSRTGRIFSATRRSCWRSSALTTRALAARRRASRAPRSAPGSASARVATRFRLHRLCGVAPHDRGDLRRLAAAHRARRRPLDVGKADENDIAARPTTRRPATCTRCSSGSRQAGASPTSAPPTAPGSTASGSGPRSDCDTATRSGSARRGLCSSDSADRVAPRPRPSRARPP